MDANSVIARWLTARLSGGEEQTLADLENLSPIDRLQQINSVLQLNAHLAHAARRLPTLDQFEVTLELVRRSTPAAVARFTVARTIAPCRCARRPRRRRPR